MRGVSFVKLVLLVDAQTLEKGKCYNIEERWNQYSGI